jgi:predicted TIM-barrel fold metal-dependent hydrolase
VNNPDAGSERYVVISADTHGGVKPAGYRDYLDPVYGKEFDTWLAEEFPLMEKGFYETVTRNTLVWGVDEDGPKTEEFFAQMELGMGDATRRVRALQDDGIVGSVIYPNATSLCAPPFNPGMELFGMVGRRSFPRDYHWAGVQAYNRWLADYCSEYPDQLAGVMMVANWDDFDEALRTVREGAEAGLRGGIPIPDLSIDRPGLHDPYWDRLWSMCEDYDLPVNSHAIFHCDARLFGRNSPNNGMLLFATGHHFRALPLALFMLGGILERHPRLKVVLGEQYADWIPIEIATLQHSLSERVGMEVFRDNLSLELRAYWERNFAVGASFMTPKEARMRHDIGLGTIMWGSDFPHPEGTYPYTRESLRLSFAEVPSKELRLILGENAARIYNFDLGQLRPIADRVGPTIKDVADPLTVAPKGFRRWSLRPEEDKHLVPTA